MLAMLVARAVGVAITFGLGWYYRSSALPLGMPAYLAMVLREYGATNPGEFFAVATEAFFGRALDFRDHEPELHRPLVAFYRQDPAVRFERLVSSEGMMKTPHGPVRIRLSTPPSGESS